MERADVSLYEDDFYAWTQQQADLLRRLPVTSNQLDAELLAEEIEDLGRSEVRSAQSLCENIIEHLLKLEYSGLNDPANHWRREITEWRLQLEKTLTRSIVVKLDLPRRYGSVLRLLRHEVPPLPELLNRVPRECPYSLDQIIGSSDEDWFPEPR
ncbi:MAG TPA: DUF29 domain-containing protein [Stellaceae bacterium]|jgi:hypothetical protein|nr:DUF29 domain-containing protein [Stellaceae bacterium]